MEVALPLPLESLEDLAELSLVDLAAVSDFESLDDLESAVDLESSEDLESEELSLEPFLLSAACLGRP